MTARPSSAPANAPSGFSDRASRRQLLLEPRSWWMLGMLASVLFPVVVLLQTPVYYQTSLRLEPVERATATRLGELLQSAASRGMLSRVHERVRSSTSTVFRASARDREPTPENRGRVVVGDADYRVMKSPNGAFVLARSPRPEVTAELAMIVADSLVETAAERRRVVTDEERAMLHSRIADLEPRIDELRRAKIVTYEELIGELGSKLASLGAGRRQSIQRERLQVQFQAAVLQQSELRDGVPLSGANVEQLLGDDGATWTASRQRLAELDRESLEKLTPWRVAEEFVGPPSRLPRSLALPLIVAFFAPLVLVGVVRLLIESP